MVYDVILFRFTLGMPSYITDVFIHFIYLDTFCAIFTLFLIFEFYPVRLISVNAT